MATIYLIRHCESEGNATRRAQAQTDALITRKGYQQIEALRQYFRDKHIDAVYASDTFRALKTVERIALDRGLEPRIRFHLREITTGIWEDLAWGNIAQDYPQEHRIWTQEPWHLITPGCGSFQKLAERMLHSLRIFAKEVGPEGVALVCTHSCSIKAALCASMGRPIEDVLKCGHGDNCSVSKLLISEDGTIQVEYTHDSSFIPSHLGRSWSGIAGADVNMATYPYSPTQKDILLKLAQADAAERAEDFDAAVFLQDVDAHLQMRAYSVALGYLGGKAVGYTMIGSDPDLPTDCGVLERLYIIPELQGKGYGPQLMGYAAHALRYDGKKQLAIPAEHTREEEGVVERFVFNPMLGHPEYFSMDLFCPPIGYPVLP